MIILEEEFYSIGIFATNLSYLVWESEKGKRKNVPGQRRYGRVNVMGAIRELDRKRVCFFVKKGNADIFMSNYTN